jgi:Fibronectin type III domain
MRLSSLQAGMRWSDVPHSITRVAVAVALSIAVAMSLPAIAGAVVMPPGPPGNLAVTPIDSEPGGLTVTVSWTAAQDNGSPISTYMVQISGAGTCASTPPTLSCSVIGLTLGKTYTVIAQAVNGGGPGAPASVQYTTPNYAGVPRNVAARVTSVSGQVASVLVSWEAPASDGGSPPSGYAGEQFRRGRSPASARPQLSSARWTMCRSVPRNQSGPA